MWLTGSLAYRLGAWLAVLASRMGLSPNAVSVLSLLTAVLAAGLAVLIGYGDLMAALVLFVLLHLAYALDCADGVLARVTGTGSSFGGILDKAIDTLVGISVPLVLAIGVLLQPGVNVERILWVLVPLVLLVSARMSLVVAMWLREAVEKRERTAEDSRTRSTGFYLKQIVGNIVLDDVSFRTFLALSWWLGFFPQLILVLSGLLSLMLLVYLRSTRREMDRQDREGR